MSAPIRFDLRKPPAGDVPFVDVTNQLVREGVLYEKLEGNASIASLVRIIAESTMWMI